MKWNDQLFIFGMAGLLLAASYWHVDGLFLGFMTTMTGLGVGFRLGRGS